MDPIKFAVLFIAVLMYAFVILFQKKKVLVTSLSAVILIILGMINPGKVFILPQDVVALEGNFPSIIFAFTHSVFNLIDWNVLMIYLGSMIVASMLIYSKVPVKLADLLIASSPNSGIAVVFVLVLTGLISTFIENVAVVLIMAPIALSMCSRTRFNPVAFLCGLALMSNIEGTATLVGDPPSMIFASHAGYNFSDFFFHNGKPSIFFIVQSGMITGCIFFFLVFARKSKEKIVCEGEKVLSWIPFMLLAVMVIGLALVSFFPFRFDYISGMFVMGVALLSILWFMLIQKKTVQETALKLKELDWETIFFLMGIFIVIGAVSESGLLDILAAGFTKICGQSAAKGFMIILLISVLLSGFIDNVPFIIAMLPVANSMAFSMRINPELYMFALLVGSCLGGNLTPYGASANVVAMGIIKKEGYDISFKKWLRIGVPFTLLTTFVASTLLWIIWS